MYKQFILLKILVLTIFNGYSQDYSAKEQKRLSKIESSIFKGQCPLERIDWLEVTENTDKDALLKLALDLEYASKIDMLTIDSLIESPLNGKFTGHFNKTIEKYSNRKVSISQDFFEKYQMMRSPICNIFMAIKSGLYKDNPEALKEAQRLYTELNKLWFSISSEVDKKDQSFNNFGNGTQNNNVFNAPVTIQTKTIQRIATHSNISTLRSEISSVIAKYNLPENTCITVQSEQNSPESYAFAESIISTLKELNYNVCGSGFFTMMPRNNGITVRYEFDKIYIRIWNL